MRMKCSNGLFASKLCPRRYPWQVNASVILLGSVGCGKSEQSEAPPPELQVVQVEQKDVPIYNEWIGTLEGLVNAQIRPQVTGYLVRQNYREGSLVKKGELLFEGGVATLLDVRQGEQLVYSAAESIPDSERQIEQTENQISLLLGRNPGPVPRNRLLTEQQTPPEVPTGLPSSLLERRPDIQAAEQILVAANANIGVAKAAYFPQITLTGEFGYQSTSLSNLFSGSRRLWSFVPQLTYPIFDAGRTRSGVELAEAEQRSALAQYEKAIQTAFRDVLRCARPVPESSRGPRTAGVAGSRAARSKTVGVSYIPGRRRYAPQRPGC